MMCDDVDKDTTEDTHAPRADEDESIAPAAEPARVERTSNAAFIGTAMGALLQAADVQVQRGDETRVLSRAQEALAEVERRRPGSIDERQTSSPAASSSGPPRPRVDAMLWIVLTAGLFAIVGWMLAYGL
jgi:nucleoid-associated protein YgaU